MNLLPHIATFTEKFDINYTASGSWRAGLLFGCFSFLFSHHQIVDF